LTFDKSAKNILIDKICQTCGYFYNKNCTRNDFVTNEFYCCEYWDGDVLRFISMKDMFTDEEIKSMMEKQK
jgi:hypothetical protein